MTHEKMTLTRVLVKGFEGFRLSVTWKTPVSVYDLMRCRSEIEELTLSLRCAFQPSKYRPALIIEGVADACMMASIMSVVCQTFGPILVAHPMKQPEGYFVLRGAQVSDEMCFVYDSTLDKDEVVPHPDP